MQTTCCAAAYLHEPRLESDPRPTRRRRKPRPTTRVAVDLDTATLRSRIPPGASVDRPRRSTNRRARSSMGQQHAAAFIHDDRERPEGVPVVDCHPKIDPGTDRPLRHTSHTRARAAIPKEGALWRSGVRGRALRRDRGMQNSAVRRWVLGIDPASTADAGTFRVVELRGFEPLTPCMPCKCSARLSYSPRTGRQSTKALRPLKPPAPIRSGEHRPTAAPGRRTRAVRAGRCGR